MSHSALSIAEDILTYDRELSLMPPPAVRSIGYLLFWQYSKIISESAGRGKANYGFIMDRFKKFQAGQINWSTSIREYIKEREDKERCLYCGEKGSLTLEHILPRARGGPDEPSNAVWVCRRCNSSKGEKRLYAWFGLENGNRIPGIAEGKYLKILYELHRKAGTLRTKDMSILCHRCDLEPLCPERGKLTVYCLEGLFTKSGKAEGNIG